MKKSIFTIILIAIISTNIYAQKEMLLDVDQSRVHWMGSNFLGFGNHHGLVTFKNGHLIIENDKIAGGEFIIDMNTIANIDGGYNNDLVDHLKNKDFFHITNHPTAKLVIKEVYYDNANRAQMKADLTIKGITRSISYEADLDYERKELATTFSIDRTQWDVTYASNLVTSIKEKMISNEIYFKVQLRFK